jgi:hypothetical protein
MLSCYIVRKLAESHKISMAKYQAPLPLQSFNARGKKIDLLNSHKLEELYHLSAPKPISKPLSYIANQLIHSFVFYSLLEEQRRLWGFAFNSDRSKDAVLYSIELQPLLAAFATCADSYISSATYLRLTSGAIDVTVGDDEPLYED